MQTGSGCPGDLDCDGIPDGFDNCPTVANADQGNEDGDRFGDVCDPCPPFADADPIADQDGDGVSDACDPRPTMPGDVISLFEGFHHGVPTNWFVVGSSWGSGGSDDVIITGDTGISSLTMTATWSTLQHETVSASILPVSRNTNDQLSVGVVDDYVHGTPNSGVTCAITSAFDAASGTIDELLSLDSINAGAATIVSDPGYSFSLGQTQIVVQRRDLTTFECAASSVSGSATGSGTSTVDETPVEIGLQLIDQNAVARVQWLMVISND
jgi:hypothetical protein